MLPVTAERILQTARQEGRKALLEPEAKEICRPYKMPTQDFHVALSELDSPEMIRGIRSYAILKGARGQSAADEEAIMDTIRRASHIMLEQSAIEQLDLNPVIVNGSGASIVDVRIILSD